MGRRKCLRISCILFLYAGVLALFLYAMSRRAGGFGEHIRIEIENSGLHFDIENCTLKIQVDDSNCENNCDEEADFPVNCALVWYTAYLPWRQLEIRASNSITSNS